ncbi:MAG: hypothetical protein IT269_05755 [Saprospiraceae bacterium]|nr:hypothetical protein [Saprospiraceae bacterium]
MKKHFFLFAALCCGTLSANSQHLNWRALDSTQNQSVYVLAGWDFGTHAAIGYSHKVARKFPLWLYAEGSMPSGKNLFDDAKLKIGVQSELVHTGMFSVSVRLNSPIRRYENKLVRMVSFGSEVIGTAGIYGRKWHLAAELGFDKAIATHIKHLPEGLEIYPGAQSGWYLPTAGNLIYGIHTGFAFGKNQISLRAGKFKNQGFDYAPFIPLYAHLGYARAF